jgi:NADPH-dependent 7-cyano-7-deazaguanine reductase QueF
MKDFEQMYLDLQQRIEQLYDNPREHYNHEDLELFQHLISTLCPESTQPSITSH